MISQFRKLLSTVRSAQYSTKIFSEKIDNIIIYESFNGKSFSDSPRMLYFYLSKALPEYKHVVVSDNDTLDEQLAHLNIETVKKILRNTLNYTIMLRYGSLIQGYHHK